MALGGFQVTLTCPLYVMAFLVVASSDKSWSCEEVEQYLKVKGVQFSATLIMDALTGFFCTPRGRSLLVREDQSLFKVNPKLAHSLEAFLRQEIEHAMQSKGEGGASLHEERRAAAKAQAERERAEREEEERERAREEREEERRREKEKEKDRVSEEREKQRERQREPEREKVIKESAANATRKPYLYELAYMVLLDQGVPLHYKEIAGLLVERGVKTTGDQVSHFLAFFCCAFITLFSGAGCFGRLVCACRC